MGPDSSTQPPSSRPRPTRKDPFVRAVVTQWRRLTGGRAARDAARGTLVACSGGSDSSALAAAMALVNTTIVIAHVRHDLRPDHEALADEHAARELAARLDRPFVTRSVAVAQQPGNAEALARRARYRALAELAAEHRLPVIVTAHHADDQLETLLMRLLRGAGPRGMAGIRSIRPLAPGVRLIRPMLTSTHAEAVAFLTRAGLPWAEDRTNRDLTRLRAALRHTIAPALRDLQPHAARAAGRAARSFADAADALGSVRLDPTTAEGGRLTWPRGQLAAAPRAVIAESLLSQLRNHHAESAGRRTPTSVEIDAVLDAIGRAKEHRWVGKLGAARVTITSQDVALDYPK